MNIDWLKMQSRNNYGIGKNPFSRISKSHQNCRIRSSKIELRQLWLGLARKISKNGRNFPFGKIFRFGHTFRESPKKMPMHSFLIW